MAHNRKCVGITVLIRFEALQGRICLPHKISSVRGFSTLVQGVRQTAFRWLDRQTPSGQTDILKEADTCGPTPLDMQTPLDRQASLDTQTFLDRQAPLDTPAPLDRLT